MADPIADHATAKMHPAAPIPRDPKRRVGPVLDGPDPQVVVESLRHLVFLIHFSEVWNLTIDILKGVAAGMDRVHVANGPGPNPFANPPDGATGVTLVAQLCDHFVLVRRCHQLAHLVHGMRERLFAINMFAASHRFHRNERVRVVRCANDDAVDVLAHLVEHHAIIFEPFGVGIFGEFLARIFFIHVAKRHDVVTQSGGFANVRAAAAADANAGDVYFGIGGSLRALENRAGQYVEQGDTRSRSMQKAAAIDRIQSLVLHG